MDAAAPIIVRNAVASDAEMIARVHTDSWRETYSTVLDDRYFSDDACQRRAAMWTRFLAAVPRPGRLAVATEAENIIGFASSGDATGPDAEHGFPPARPLHLFTIYLLAEAHGSGAGQDLLDAVAGHEPAQLWVLQGNARAIRFYERNGFALDGCEFVDPDEPRLVELRMVR